MGREENQPLDPDRLLDVREAAALLGTKPGTLYAWVSRGKVPHRKVGSLVRFHRGELLAWTEGENRQAGETAAPRPKLRVV